ncbi:hypothetical protein [Psychrobacter vallis]|uniref:hypothetical protein n=1 Tax=Psychrobacter vallis TaxID=248451 RepID=UPI001917D2B3|nr:hypothetical protein [Psychrobacter vallis]
MNYIDKYDLTLKFELVQNHFVSDLDAHLILTKIFENPKGTWTDFRTYIDYDTYINDYDGLDVSICWLNEINMENKHWRLIAFFENKTCFSKIVIFNMETLSC